MKNGSTAKLFYASARSHHFDVGRSLHGKLCAIIKKLKFADIFGKRDLIPVKMHFGNPGVHRTIPPLFVREVVDELKEVGANPFVTDSARLPGYTYLEHALKCGYDPTSLGCPVVIADGLFGNDSIKVKSGKYLKEVSIPSAIYDAPGMVVLTHVTGHAGYGLGGALKNLAMGCVSQKCRGENWQTGDRGRMHTMGGREIKMAPKKCVRCGACIEICPTESMSYAEPGVTIRVETCFNCARCAHVCQYGGLTVDEYGDDYYETLTEAAAAAQNCFEKGKIIHISFLTNVQPECDCMPISDTPLVQDIGILAGDDMIAIDWATLDLVGKQVPLPNSRAEGLENSPENDVLSQVNNRTPRVGLEYGEKIGMGTTKYKLTEVKSLPRRKAKKN